MRPMLKPRAIQKGAKMMLFIRRFNYVEVIGGALGGSLVYHGDIFAGVIIAVASGAISAIGERYLDE